MKLKPFILYGLSVAVLSGCAGLNEKNDQLSRQVADLRTSIKEANAKLEDLNNKFLLLQEKVEASRADAGKALAPQASSIPAPVPVSPPEGLKVVSLGDEPKAAPEVKAPVRAKEGTGVVPASFTKPPAAPPEKPKGAQSPDALYNHGQDLFLSGKYEEARGAFLSLVKSYPDHTLADNALYWVGESYYTEKDFDRAVARFKEVSDRYPEENKAPDALFKEGLSYMEMDNPGKAKESFDKLVKRYPDSEAADKAKKTLEKLSGAKKEGTR